MLTKQKAYLEIARCTASNLSEMRQQKREVQEAWKGSMILSSA